MSRLSRPLTFAMLVLALTACEAVPNLNVPGQTLRGEVSGNITAKTKIAVTDQVPLDFSDAAVIPVSNRQFSYALPDNKANVFLAAFEDENGNNRWDPGEAITSDPNSCAGCSYLRVSRVGTNWTVTEQTASGPKSATLTDSTITFKA
ncbi:hypothetical protein D3C87_983140 [compost metagenome]